MKSICSDFFHVTPVMAGVGLCLCGPGPALADWKQSRQYWSLVDCRIVWLSVRLCSGALSYRTLSAHTLLRCGLDPLAGTALLAAAPGGGLGLVGGAGCGGE